MSTISTRLSTDEAHAAIFALAVDLREQAANLHGMADKYVDGNLTRRDMHAGDLAGAVRMIAHLLAPLDALIAQLDREVDRAA